MKDSMDKMKNKFAVSLLAGAVIALAGCGGGGGGGSSSSSNDGDDPPETAEPTPEVEPVAAYFKAINHNPDNAQYTGSGVNVAVYDSGILKNHSEFPETRVSDFSGAFASELVTDGTAPSGFTYNLVDTSKFAQDDDEGVDGIGDPDITDRTLSHGSIVTAIAAGETLGLGRDSQIIAVDVTSTATTDADGNITDIDPTGEDPTDASRRERVDTWAAYLHLAEKGNTDLETPNLQIDFASMSLTTAYTYPTTSDGSPSDVVTKIKEGTDTAIISVAGNAGRPLSGSGAEPYSFYEPIPFNASFEELLVIVGATNQEGTEMWVDSNTPGTDASIQDRFLVAPGVAIEGADYRDPDDFATQTGTSMAGPLVAGAAAMVKEKFSQLSNRQVLQILLDTASTSIPDYDPAIHGQGLLDIEAALDVDPSTY
jgi:subtilisin family serine protease